MWCSDTVSSNIIYFQLLSEKVIVRQIGIAEFKLMTRFLILSLFERQKNCALRVGKIC